MTRAELKSKQIAVLMGGWSGEREVSLRTGKAVLKALQGSGYRACGIDVGRDLPQQLREDGAEVAFVALHGRFGEDGTVQGLLEMMGIDYTGCGVFSSSLTMDKIATKKILIYHDVPTPDFKVVRRGDDLAPLMTQCNDFPLVVKPCREGSTLGVTIARDRESLHQGLQDALELDARVLVEEYIPGREVTVSVLDGEALPIIEVVPRCGFYDFKAKYVAGATEYLLPAPLESALYRRIAHAAVTACDALECRGAVRADFRVRGNDFYCLEVNAIPGMTETSLLPKAAVEAGIAFDELVQRILEGAALDK